jgi:hypothetical protein
MLGKLAVAAGLGLDFFNPSRCTELYVSFTEDWRLLPGFVASGPLLIGVMERVRYPVLPEENLPDSEDADSVILLRTPGTSKVHTHVLIVGAHWEQLEIADAPVLRWTYADGVQTQPTACGLRPFGKIPLPDRPELQAGTALRLEGHLPVRGTWDVKETTLPAREGLWPVRDGELTGKLTISRLQEDTYHQVSLALEWDPRYRSQDTIQAYTDTFLSTDAAQWEHLAKLSSMGRHYRVIEMIGQREGRQIKNRAINVLQGRPGKQQFIAIWDEGGELDKVKFWTGRWGFFYLEFSLTVGQKGLEEAGQ